MGILSSRTLKRAAVVVAVTLATPATLLAASATPAAADICGVRTLLEPAATCDSDISAF